MSIPLSVQQMPPVNMASLFPDLPKEFPPYYLCQFSKRNYVDTTLDNRKEAFVRGGAQITRGENLGYEISPSHTWRFPQAPADTFNEFTSEEVTQPDFVNMGGRGDVFYGYARNIDVESELKQINFRDDKCFDNNYKVDPMSPKTSLFRHKDIIVKDYIKEQQGSYRGACNRPLKCIDPKTQPLEPSSITGFDVCGTFPNYFEVGPGFNLNLQVCESVPPEKAFNNMTKRRMVYSRQPSVNNPERYM